MKIIILAGGYGTRLSEETGRTPKPMVEIGDMPILWHIMKIYSTYGFNEFVILLGYKGYMIKEYISNYLLHQSNITIDLISSKLEIHDHTCESWKVTLLETGLNTMTGGRLKRAQKYIGNETFILTYGDGLADIKIDQLVKFHKSHGKALTMTAVQPIGQFGIVSIEANNRVSQFMEKPTGDKVWINGGFFVCEPKIFDYLKDDQTIFEKEPLENLAKKGELFAYKHHGFWKCMDTIRDKNQLNEMWNTNSAKWKVW